MNKIYLSPPHVGDLERELLLDAFDSNWVAPMGPHVDAFEREVAAFLQVEDAAAVCSGTSALHLVLMLLGIGKGDRVVCSSLTFAASANPILYCGAEPVFIDSDEETWNMDPALLEVALKTLVARGKPPKAVVVVDLYGQCADYDRIFAITGRYNIPVIEDAAESLGATYKDVPAGAFGKMSILSFNGNKIITTSGGGMVVSNDRALVERARFLATQARDPAPHYEHSAIGYNYRMSNLLAAVGRAQLQNLTARVAARRRIFGRYHDALAAIPGIGFMPEAPYGTSTRWLTCITVDDRSFGSTREDIRIALEEQDIEARPIWKPMHLQPVFSGCEVFGGRVSEALFERGLCLPSGSNLCEGDQDRVISIVDACYGRMRQHRVLPQ